MATAIFFGLPAHGHINPTLPIVAELVRQGEHIIYYSTEEFRTPIEATRADFRAYGDAFPFNEIFIDDNGFRIIRRLFQVSQGMLEHLLSEVKEAQPDYILYDSMAAWGHYFAQLLHVPIICSMTTFALTRRHVSQVPSLVLMGLRSANEIFRANALGRQISRAYGVKKLDYIGYVFNTGQMTLLYTSRYFQSYTGAFDDTFKFVGPSIAPRMTDPAFPFEALHDGPLLYISLGTLFHRQNEFYRCCFQAFEQSDYQVVMSVGQHTTLEQLGPAPENFIVRPSVPQLEILQRATLFITHAGMNSTNEALYYGVPLLAIPQAKDQHYIARRIEQLGAGIRLSRKHMTASRLRNSADEIRAQANYAQASARIGESLRQAGGVRAALKAIQQFKQMYHIGQ
jgi:MGT family glycosyltransferase